MLRTESFRLAVCVVNACILVLLASGQVACTSKKHVAVVSVIPPVSKAPSRGLPPDPIPKAEPRSRYGNPPSYTVLGKRYHTLSTSKGFAERGIASWYGKKFHGRRTSSGETYDMYAMTAAHTRLPLPTYVQVTNLENGKQVVVRVNDRGPFHQNRVIDLSYSAARKLDIVTKGTGLVEIRALDPLHYPLAQKSGTKATQNTDTEKTGSTAIWNQKPDQHITHGRPKVFVQVGAFSKRTSADQLLNQLRNLNLGAISVSSIMRDAGQLHRVRIGPLPTVQSADITFTKLTDMVMREHRIVIE